MSRNFRVGIVGATGIAGQQFVVALQSHPWFTITRLEYCLAHPSQLGWRDHAAVFLYFRATKPPAARA